MNQEKQVKQIIAVDPGPTQSAFVLYKDGLPVDHGILKNDQMRARLFAAADHVDLLAIEMVASYGMPVGKDVFETVLWIGRFIEAWGGPYRKIYRQQVKLHVCKDSRAKDANIRQALIDRYPRTGGGKTPQIGTKAQPGPLYGISKDVWSALAVAVTCAEAKTHRAISS